MIGLSERGTRIRLDINNDVARAARLRISSKLLALARPR